MGSSRIGCQTYSWEMLGADWVGTPENILDTVSGAGYAGVEFSNAMIGDYFRRPDQFAVSLQQRNLDCAAFAYATTGFSDAARYQEDLAGALEALEFSAELGVPLCLGGAASESRDGYQSKIEQAVTFYRTVAERGADMEVSVCVHPHSHHGSLLESAEEYDQLLFLTADSGLMFNPDVGHIVRGGQDLMDCMRRHRARITHVHIKDVDDKGSWQPLGQGVIDWRALFDFLNETDYRGWIVAEEESEFARKDPGTAVARNRQFLKTMGL